MTTDWHISHSPWRQQGSMFCSSGLITGTSFNNLEHYYITHSPRWLSNACARHSPWWPRASSPTMTAGSMEQTTCQPWWLNSTSLPRYDSRELAHISLCTLWLSGVSLNSPWWGWCTGVVASLGGITSFISGVGSSKCSKPSSNMVLTGQTNFLEVCSS